MYKSIFILETNNIYALGFLFLNYPSPPKFTPSTPLLHTKSGAVKMTPAKKYVAEKISLSTVLTFYQFNLKKYDFHRNCYPLCYPIWG